MTRRLLAGLAASALVLIGACAERVDHKASPTPTTVRCLEDMPCWRCETMGNRICGSEHR